MAPGVAALIAAWMLVQGLSALPSLSIPEYIASTCSLSGSIGISPQRPAAHGATSRHWRSPGTAMKPGAHGSEGSTASQPRSPSCTKPSPQPSGGTPAGMQLPSSRNHSPGGHGMSAGRPGAMHTPSSRCHSPGKQTAGASTISSLSSAPLQPMTVTATTQSLLGPIVGYDTQQ